MFYYAFIRRIKTVTLLYHLNYVRSEVDEVIERELAWQNPGGHYFDDLYQSPLYFLNRLNIIPESAHDKFFKCGT